MKALFKLLVFFASITAGFCGNVKTDTLSISYYEGSIGTYKVRMLLHFADMSITGQYAYVKNDKTFILDGKTEQGKITLVERFEEGNLEKQDFKTVNSGYFYLEAMPDSSITGVWTNAEKNKKLPVRLVMKTFIRYTSASVEVSYRNPNHINDTTDIEEFNELQLLNLRDDKVKSIINENLKVSEYEDLVRELNKDPTKNYLIDSEADSTEEEMYSVSYYNSGTDEVEFLNEDIITISRAAEGWQGGAHPNHGVSYSNYVLKDGQLLNLQKAFKPDYKEYLNRIGENYFRKSLGINKDSTLSSLGFWFENDKFRVNDNFYFSTGGLNFFYNNYEIAPYAMGPQDFCIPYKALKPIINPDGPLGWILK